MTDGVGQNGTRHDTGGDNTDANTNTDVNEQDCKHHSTEKPESRNA